MKPARSNPAPRFPRRSEYWAEAVHRLGRYGKLLCEKVLSPGPESHSGGISPGKTTGYVALNLVEPFLAVGQALNQPCIHRLDEPDFGGRQRAEGLGSHEECERSRLCCSASYLITLSAR